jgi:hypothetical protein
MTSDLPVAESVAQRVLNKVKPARPPIDLDRVLGVWHRVTLVEEDLDGSGYLLPIGKLGAEIIVNRSDPLEVRRFTIAHELGHWVLGLIWEKKSGEFRQPTAIAGRAEIEKWCDSFATSLLMPQPLMESLLANRDMPTFIDAVLKGCRDFNVSKHAFFLRVWELSNIQIAILTKDASSPFRGFTLERHYGDESGKRKLTDLFEQPQVQMHLEIESPLIFFRGKTGNRSFRCSGRRTSRSQVTIAVIFADAQ